jgi:molecular chaperone GrpE
MNEEAPDTTASPETPAATEPSAEEALKKLQVERDTLYDQLLRRQAEFDNYRKRVAREMTEFREQAEAELSLALLPVLDGLERALTAPADGPSVDEYRKGIELIHKQLLDILKRRGLKPIAALGQTFDPLVHHALERVETTERRDQEVVEELQRGYTFKHRLLRPALVKVAVHPVMVEKTEPEESSGSSETS